MEDIEPRTIAMSLLLVVSSLAAIDVLFVAPSPIGADVTDEETVPAPDGEQAAEAATEPEVLPVAQRRGFEPKETTEFSFLGQIIPPQEAAVISRVLLLGGDRAGSVTWADTPKVRVYFFALKEALHGSFTAELEDLRDETQFRDDDTSRNLLSFVDTGISSERIMFVRIRQRLYEVHAAPGHEAELLSLLNELTGWPEEPDGE